MSDLDPALAAALDAASAHARAYLASLRDRPVWPRATYAQLYEAFREPLPEDGTSPVQVVEELAAKAEPGLDAMSGGRFFGFVIGGTLPAALATDWLVSAWDQNAGLAEATPAASAVEQVAGEWLVDLLGLPAGSAVGLVTGGMMANFTCLASARRSVLDRAGWDVKQRGLTGAPALRLVVGQHRHDTIDRSATYLGIGLDQLRPVPADDQGRMLPAALAEVLAAEDGPVIVCLQAGEVHTGAFDPFPELVSTARAHDAWIHVDGAFGLWAAASKQTKALTTGMADADSWATDGHKTLNVPYDCGFAIVRDPVALQSVFGVHADYLIGGVSDPLERTPEFSRRARGFATWAALKSLGRTGVDALVVGLSDRASQMAAGLSSIPGLTVVNEVVFTQVVVHAEDDEATQSLGRRLLEEGTSVLTPGMWNGRAVLRCSVSSWATSESDVAATVAAVRRLQSP